MSKKATDSLTKTNLPSTSTSKTGQPSNETTTSCDAHGSRQNAIFKTATSNDTSTEGSESEIDDLCVTPDFFKNVSPKMTPLSPKMASDSSQSQDVSSPMARENVGDGDVSCELKFISTHSRMKKSPLSSKRFVPLVRSMRCRKSLKRLNEEQVFNGEIIAQPKIKRVRIVVTPLTKEKYMHHVKLTSNKTDLVKMSPSQKSNPHHKETGGSSDLTLANSMSNGAQSTSDEDYEPPDASDRDNTTAACTERKRKSVAPVRYVPSASNPQNRREQSSSPSSKSLDSWTGSIARSRKKRKSVPPVKYAPFAGKTRYQRDKRSRERSHTPDSESVISESVTSSVGPDSPLVNLRT